MDCDQIADEMMRLLDDELTGIASDAVHAHFGECERCARFYQSLRSQLVLHRWSAEAPFTLNTDDACLPADIPDFNALQARIRGADVAHLGRLLYEVLKAEFYSDYTDLEPLARPLADPAQERTRAADMVEELRDWHDADEVDGVDLAAMARRLGTRPPPHARVELLIEGMEAVMTAAPELIHVARYLQAIAHVKARRQREATGLFEHVLVDGPPSLARISSICLATLPVLLGDDPQASIEALSRCLLGDGADAMVHYNLAKAWFAQDGEVGSQALHHLREAEASDPALVTRQLGGPKESAFRAAVEAARAGPNAGR